MTQNQNYSSDPVFRGDVCVCVCAYACVCVCVCVCVVYCVPSLNEAKDRMEKCINFDLKLD